MFTLLSRQTAAALRVLIVLTILIGIGYPLLVWGVARIPGLSGPAEGSVITVGGRPMGSALIGVDPVPTDPNADPYFHTRPSASAKDVLGPGDPATSGGSNKAGDNPDLLEAVTRRKQRIAAREGVAESAIPPDAVTASASGLDAHISPAYAELQVARVVRVTGLVEQRVRELVAANTDGRVLGFLGESGVNVTKLNLALKQVSRR